MAVGALIGSIGSVINSLGSVFAAREQRALQEEITDQAYINYLGQKELQAEQNETWILLAVIAFIVVLVILIARK